MPSSFKIERRVEFSETDMVGIVHYSNFFKYMETAEHAFFRSLGMSIVEHQPDAVGWPRVHAECDYRRPLKFEDVVEVELLVKERREKSIVYTFIFRKVAGDSREEIARGGLAVACVRRDPQTGAMKAVPIPAHIAALIEPAPPEMFERARP